MTEPEQFTDAELARQIDACCDRLEQAWHSEHRLRIEDLIVGEVEPLRSQLLLHLIQLEVHLRTEANEAFQDSGYLDRFPEDRELVNSALHSHSIDTSESLMDQRENTEAVVQHQPADRNASFGQPTFISADPRQSSSANLPQSIGRYRVESILGQGGFGLVYLAHDEQLARRVAVKVPHTRLVSRAQDAEMYLAEARTVANLDHPGIVPVHDVGSTEDCPCYIVSRYIEGTDLAKKVKQDRLNHRRVAELVATVAEALHYAHKQGLVHRDVKPGNILIGKDGTPYVVDFGLALREENVGTGPKYAGTPAYMSPEQARGEGHRVDGRSDIFSLGVVLYELLTGRQPFRGETRAELFEQVTRFDARPPRQYDDNIPKELERICHKAMAKRATERYSTAKDFGEELRMFLQGQTVNDNASPGAVMSAASAARPSTRVDSVIPSPTSFGLGSSDSQPIKIVPKGLRSFDVHDADFFLELLPGPRDRNGLPDSLRFWKTRVQETDPDNTFSVGLMYGPSGCGKSSLVKAGLLPRLSEAVIPIYVEATPDETETRLLHGLRKCSPSLADNLSLKNTLAAMRRGQGIPPGKKVLIVLDQFEQWLHTKKEQENTELVQALRQCDGGRVQCIVMVRDDFWLAVSRFLRDLEIRLVEGENSALTDLFDLDHARKVLAAFGRAFGRLPEIINETSSEQRNFLKQSVVGLAEGGKVTCVRLALFAEMMKGKPWTPAELNVVGGTTGVGVTFLEETFTASTAPPGHRYHQKAARAVMKALLPDSGTDIKGHMRSRQELLLVSGYADRPKDFDELIRILDSEIRLITPTDPEGIDNDSISRVDVGQKYYQLTHDYLVHSLREWLTRKQRETPRGRAEMRLDELSAAWNAKPERRHLPSVVEWINIMLLTAGRRRTEPQRRMLSSATRLHGYRWGAGLLGGIVAIFALNWYASRINQKALIASTEISVNALQTTNGVGVPFALRDLESLPPELVLAELRRHYDQDTGQRKLAVAYALADLGEVDLDFLITSVSTAASGECPNIITALEHSSDLARQSLTKAIAATNESEDWNSKAHLAIVALRLGDIKPASDMLQFESRSDPIQRTVFIATFPSWHGNLDELAKQLHDVEDAAFRSGLCLAIGSIDDVDDQARQSWQSIFSEWFMHCPDAGTHSAAGWALRNWKCDLPKIGPANRAEPSRDWVVTPNGLTMLRIPAGEFIREEPGGLKEEAAAQERGQQRVRLTRDFFLSDREITVGLFQQFIEDVDYEGERPGNWEGVRKKTSPTAEHPVQNVSWNDAVMFCNWLSHREGFAPCYERRGSSDFTYEDWRLIDEANGYRLPSEAQWEHACRAGTTTTFASGDEEAWLKAYSVYVVNSGAPINSVCGSKLCNAWGLFDMHGNVREWCDDRHAPYGDEPLVTDPHAPEQRGKRRVVRGGSHTNAQQCRSSRRSREYPSYRNYSVGFRVAHIPSASVQPVSLAKNANR